MATIRKRGKASWQAQIRHIGFPNQSKTFKTRLAAQRWINSTTSDMEAGAWNDLRLQRSIFVSDLLRRWRDSLHPNTKVFCDSKLHTVEFLARELEGVSLAAFDNEFIMEYAKRRSETVRRSTLGTELSYLSQCIDFCRTIFKTPLPFNPVHEVRGVLGQLNMVGGSRCVERRLRDGEYELLQDIDMTPWLRPVMDIAVNSAMRQGEIFRMKWSDLDFKKGTIFIKDRKDPKEKEGNDQIIPMFPPVREALLRAQEFTGDDGRVLHVTSTKSIGDAFRRVRIKAGIYDLRFHDLRHEGVSRLFEKGWSIPQVAAVSGHKDWTQLKRYTQLKPGDLLTAYG